MRREPLQRLSIRAALTVGFGLVLGLWLFTGWAFSRHLLSVERQATDLTQRYMRAQDVLSSIRAQLNFSSIILRDALLDESARSKRSYRTRLETNYQAINAAIDAYEPMLSPSEAAARVNGLRAEIGDFHLATIQILEAEALGASRLDLLNDAIAPRRASAIALSDEIRALNRRAFVQHQTATAAIHREAERQWWWTIGGALVTTLGIALLAVVYAGRLERGLRGQRQKDRESARELQRLSSRLVAAQEEERRHIARELHDEVGQVLSAIKVDLLIAQRDLEAQGQGASTRAIEEAQHMADGALQTVRDLSQLLRPAVLDDLGLPAAVEGLLCGLERRQRIHATLTQEALPPRLTPELEVTAFRIIQEALTNVARHSGASHVVVDIAGHPGAVVVSVRDDGCGFTPDAPPGLRRGLGLVGIRERVADHGGTVDIVTAPGQGTQVVVRLPTTRHVGEPPRAEHDLDAPHARLRASHV